MIANHIKSNTVQFLALLSVTNMPGLSDPLWLAIADMGVPPDWVAGLKVGSFALMVLGAWWGRTKAEGPLGK